MPKTNDLPGVEGPGVSTVKIAEIDKAIAKYQKKKEARCAVSPDEIVAKNELRAALHANRDRLPVDGEGVPFYVSDDRRYSLQEKLKIEKVGGDEEDDD